MKDRWSLIMAVGEILILLPRVLMVIHIFVEN